MTVFVLLVTSVSAEAALRIERAFCGSNGSWRDVTAFLQSQVRDDKLSVKISQPFREIGGDPAPGEIKHLIVDYRLSGTRYRLDLKEQGPVAFTVELPSPDAVAPGADPAATAVMADATARLHGERSGAFWFGCLGYGIALVAMIWAVVVTIQLRNVKKQFLK